MNTTSDDHVDHSKFISFFNEEIVFMSTVVLKQAIKDIEMEVLARSLLDIADQQALDIASASFLQERARELIEESNTIWNKIITRMQEQDSEEK